MLLGIKTGLVNDTFDNLDATGARAVEIWFDASRRFEYAGMLSELKRRGIAIGLHYWGVLEDKTWTTIAYPDRRIIRESMDLIQKTIETAASYGAAYVNIHPGVRARVALDFSQGTFQVLSDPVPLDRAESLFIENVTILNRFARDRNVLLTVETVPARVYDHWDDTSKRVRAKEVYELPYGTLKRAADAGIAIANDFGHTAAQVITNDRTVIRNFLVRFTQQLSDMTRLIHLGFIVPPFNGTDFHDHLDNPDFFGDRAIPDRNLTMKLLQIVNEKHPDAYVIPEPAAEHRKNFVLARKLLAEALEPAETTPGKQPHF